MLLWKDHEETNQNNRPSSPDALTEASHELLEAFADKADLLQKEWRSYCEWVMSEGVTENQTTDKIEEVKSELSLQIENINLTPPPKSKSKKEDNTIFQEWLENASSNTQIILDYSFWFGLIKIPSCKVMIDAGYKHPNRLSLIEWKCPICKERNYTHLKRNKTLEKDSCSSCGHLAQPKSGSFGSGFLCICNGCTTANKPMKDLITDLSHAIEDFLDSHTKEINCRTLNPKTTKSRDFDIIMSQRNNEFSLGVDARNFINTYTELHNSGIEFSEQDLIDNMNFRKQNKKVVEELLEKGVLLIEIQNTEVTSKHLEYLKEELKEKMLSCIRIELKSMHGYTKYTSGIPNDFVNEEPTSIGIVNRIDIYFNDHTLNSVSTANFKTKFIINPYYLNSASLDTKNEKLRDNNLTSKFSRPLFHSPQEHYWYTKLASSNPNTIVVPNYPIQRIIDIRQLYENLTKEEIKYIYKLHVNFAIYNNEGAILEVVELQIGKHHNDQKYIARDNLKARIFELAGVKFREIHGVDEKNFHA